MYVSIDNHWNLNNYIEQYATWGLYDMCTCHVYHTYVRTWKAYKHA